MQIKLNGKAVQLKRSGKSREGRSKYMASAAIPGMPGAQAFIIVYQPLPKALRMKAKTTTKRGPGRPPRPKRTPAMPPPAPSPVFTEDVQASMIKLLQNMTRRLDAIEGQRSAAHSPEFHARKKPHPHATA